MEWMRNNELPTWAYLLGSLSLLSGALINLFTKNVLLGIPLICLGVWLARWWYEVPVDHPRFQKMSERRFRFYRNMILVCSWGMLITMVAVICFYIFGVLPP
ncbi:MAG: hypothetical protein OXU27_12580 [Candidatus Poribacteria bacterium]|nr:hypothetical protein [Candidatus Poribacteria bacterium]MDE0327366.1 hypothetical protein [Candidatus Poribacteria bacterium]